MQFRISCSKMCTLCINYKRRLHCIWLTDRNMILSINLDFRIKAGFLHVIVDQEKTVWESGHVMIAQGELSVQVMSVIIYYCYLHFIIYLVSWLVAQGMYFSDAHWIRGHFSFFLRCTNVFTEIIVSDTCLVHDHPFLSWYKFDHFFTHWVTASLTLLFTFQEKSKIVRLIFELKIIFQLWINAVEGNIDICRSENR